MTSAKADAIDQPLDIIPEGINDKIYEIFKLFDHESTNTVDIRDMRTIVRALDCYPSEAELAEVEAQVIDEESGGAVTYEKFLPVMAKILVEKRFMPATYEELERAFQVLDVNENGFLTEEEVSKFLLEEGDPLSKEELEDFLAFAVQDDSTKLFYKTILQSLVPSEAT